MTFARLGMVLLMGTPGLAYCGRGGASCDGEAPRGGPSRAETRPERGGDRRPFGWGMESEDWAKAEEFYKEHSPRRLQAFYGLSPEEQKRPRAFMLFRWRGMQTQRFTLEGSRELYKNQVQQIEIEDEVFGIRQQLKSVPHGTPEAERLRAEARDKVTQLVDKQLEERSLRIARLEKILPEETEKLKRDQGRKDELVQRRLHWELDRPEGPPRRRDADRRDADNRSDHPADK